MGVSLEVSNVSGLSWKPATSAAVTGGMKASGCLLLLCSSNRSGLHMFAAGSLTHMCDA